MSCSDFDAPSVFSARTVKARVAHRCCECSIRIAPGEDYEYVFGVWEGDAQSFHTCKACSKEVSWLMRSDTCCHQFGELATEIGESMRNGDGYHVDACKHALEALYVRRTVAKSQRGHL